MTFWILLVFLAFFSAHFLVDTVLSRLNLKHAAAMGAQVPAPLQGHISQDTARKSLDYTLVKGRFAQVHRVWSDGITLWVLLGGVLPWLDGLVLAAGLEGPHRFVAFLVALGVALSLAGLPFRLYGTFVIEARFGFNRTTWRLWLLDRLKALGVAAMLGLPFLYGVHAFMAYSGPWWWLWLFGFMTAVQVAMVWLYPAFIAPLFNRFSTLPPGDLRTRVEALAARAGFQPSGLYLMDASRRSGHSNAYFTGFFRPRIVLFDTLLDRVDTEEALSVLAHEMGHYKARHIHKALGIHMVGSLASLYVLSLLIGWPPLFHAFGLAEPGLHTALALFMLGGGAFTFWTTPIMAWFSRRNEFEADGYSIRLTGQASDRPGALRTALVKLNEDNLANLHPHPWFSQFYYSHPPLVERLQALEAQQAPHRSAPPG